MIGSYKFVLEQFFTNNEKDKNTSEKQTLDRQIKTNFTSSLYKFCLGTQIVVRQPWRESNKEANDILKRKTITGKTNKAMDRLEKVLSTQKAVNAKKLLCSLHRSGSVLLSKFSAPLFQFLNFFCNIVHLWRGWG